MTVNTDMTAKEILNDFKENYAKVRKLLEEDSKNDPGTEPYLSKYKAKEILINMQESLKKTVNSETDVHESKLDAMRGTILLTIGIIDMETEELTASEKVFVEAVDLLSPNGSKPEIVLILIEVYNNLGILWSNRQEPEKAKTYLVQAKELYETFKCTLQMPLSIDHIVHATSKANVGNFMVLEKANTLTLYYLAQVYGSLKEDLKSAIYCHVTLRRQLQYNDYEPIDWSLNSATLSQYFAGQDGFYQSRHHLAAASKILEQYGESLLSVDSTEEEHLAKLETFRHRSADVARCWAKYCLILMNSSKTRLMDESERMTEAITDMSNLTLEDSENICGGDLKSLIFPDLDVSDYESKVTCKFALTFQDAREIFLCCQEWLNKGKEYYKLDSLPSDYIELVQDSSEAYNVLVFFEEDDERKAKMLKRRIDMVEDLLKEINPLYYQHYCRQLWFELGLTYSDILNIKLDKLKDENQKPTPHALKKINHLCEKAMENYEHFLNTVKDKNGVLPEKLTYDLAKGVISAYAFMGRNSMKRITLDKSLKLKHILKSYESYKAVVDICSKDEEVAKIMHEEYTCCQEMVNCLTIKIKQLEAELSAQ